MSTSTDDKCLRTDSRAIALLNEMRVLAGRMLIGGLVAFVVGAVLLAGQLLGHLGVIVGFVGIIGGPIFVSGGLGWFRLIPKAEQALKLPPQEVRLDVRLVQGGYGSRGYTMARLRPAGSGGRTLAKFSSTMHWQIPRYLIVTDVPAQLYGVPRGGAVVVACCPQGVIAGRLKRSIFRPTDWR